MLSSSSDPKRLEKKQMEFKTKKEGKVIQENTTGDQLGGSFFSWKMSSPFFPQTQRPGTTGAIPSLSKAPKSCQLISQGVPQPPHLISAQLLHRFPLNGERR